MLPYLVVLTVVMIWMIVEQTSISRKSYWMPLFLLSLFAGIRKYSVGTDSGTYTKIFRNNTDVNNFNFGEHVEPAYQLLTYLILLCTHNYYWLFFITALIVVSSYLYIIKKLSSNYILSVFFFITLGTYTFFFNGLRQGLAMAILALSTPYLINKKIIKFILIVILASLFHGTALIIIPFYFLLHLQIKIIYKLIIIFVTTFLTSSFLISYLASNNPRYEVYTQESERGGLVVLSFNIVMVLFLYIVNAIDKHKTIFNRDTNQLLQLYAMGTVFVIPFAIQGLPPSGPQRMLNYFSWVLVLLLPMALQKINNVGVYILAIVLSLTYFILTTTSFSGLTPYNFNPIFKIL